MIEIFVILVIVCIIVVPLFFGSLCAAIGLCYIIHRMRDYENSVLYGEQTQRILRTSNQKQRRKEKIEGEN